MPWCCEQLPIFISICGSLSHSYSRLHHSNINALANMTWFIIIYKCSFSGCLALQHAQTCLYPLNFIESIIAFHSEYSVPALSLLFWCLLQCPIIFFPKVSWLQWATSEYTLSRHPSSSPGPLPSPWILLEWTLTSGTAWRSSMSLLGELHSPLTAVCMSQSLSSQYPTPAHVTSLNSE